MKPTGTDEENSRRCCYHLDRGPVNFRSPPASFSMAAQPLAIPAGVLTNRVCKCVPTAEIGPPPTSHSERLESPWSVLKPSGTYSVKKETKRMNVTPVDLDSSRSRDKLMYVQQHVLRKVNLH